LCVHASSVAKPACNVWVGVCFAPQAALAVALKAVGVESIKAAEEPSMLVVANAYHHKFLVNDSTLTQLMDK